MQQRAHERFVADFEVDCEVQGELHRIHVYDICMDGCMIDAGMLRLYRGDTLTLRIQDQLFVSGKVVWRQDYIAGVKFAEELPLSAIMQIGIKPVAVAFDHIARRDRYGRVLQAAA